MLDAWAGELLRKTGKQQWVQDTLQTVQEQNIWRELAVGMIDEIGAVKLIAIVLLFTMLTLGSTIFGAVAIFKRVTRRPS